MPEKPKIPAFLPSFSRKSNRSLNAAQRRWLAEVLPEFSLKLTPDFSLQAALPQHKEYWLEIGLGAGEHALAQAKLHPEIGYIGSEVYSSTLAGLVSKLKADKINNMRLFTADARILLSALPEASLERVYILFPDPWPKRRHFKRRLIQIPTLEMIASRLKQGGELRIATDSIDYLNWMMAHLVHVPELIWRCSWDLPFDGHVPTRYQQKAEIEGRNSYFLQFIRENLKKDV